MAASRASKVRAVVSTLALWRSLPSQSMAVSAQRLALRRVGPEARDIYVKDLPVRLMLTKGRPGDSNANGLRMPVVALLGVCLLGASAAIGAWVYSHYTESRLTVSSSLDLYQANLVRESEFSRAQVDALAEKVGELQAKIIEMDGLSRRVAEVAGVPHTDPEVQTGLDQAAPPIMDYVNDAPARPFQQKMSWQPKSESESESEPESESTLDARLEFLRQEVSRQKDWFRMMDVALTRRVGVEASLPTLMPVNYPYLSSSFGWRRHPISRRHVMHEGLDFSAPRGTPIYAASGGVVTWAGYKTGYGNTVDIYHGNEIVTRYAHASKVNVKAGDIVERGQTIAAVGSTGHSTGPHLHFEVRMAGHALDPTLFLDKPMPEPTLLTDASDQLDVVTTKVR